MVDTHAHLDFPVFAGSRPRIFKEMAEAGVTRLINPGVDLRASRTAVQLAHEHPQVYAAVGWHPTEKDQPSLADLSELTELAYDQRVVAIGEVGMDLYHLRLHPQTTPSQRDQEQLLERFVAMAEEVVKPLILHAREAHEAVLKIVQETSSQPIGMVFHSFDGTQEVATKLLDAGAYVGINNILGYPKNQALRELVKWLPLDRILLETDAPFLPPAERRGGEATPADVRAVAQLIAELRGVELEVVDRATSSNAATLFGIEI